MVKSIAAPRNTSDTEIAHPDAAWCTHHRGAIEEHLTRITFGAVRWDGSFREVEITQSYGSSTAHHTLLQRFGGTGTRAAREDNVRRVIEANPWLSGQPLASLNIQSANAEECREAAAALLRAADLIDTATAR